eukprot:TRINITY_DN80137_c0_g1_i1.p1 TRINITY_DN80137_c0_g1~~TRINITY_DN80137_c0_g1_i1.p1  ORF type:complete len:1004 (-),score=236.63 TRINITY_DN80137_c0_g1_i1:182-3193(-)
MGGDVPEWMQLLAEQPDEHGEPKASLKTANAASDVGTSEGDAVALLTAVKVRLEEDSEPSRYPDFLAAISSNPIDYDAAASLLAEHSDLLAGFKECYGEAPRRRAALHDPVAPEAQHFIKTGKQARLLRLVQLMFVNANDADQYCDRVSQYLTQLTRADATARRLYLLRGPPGIAKVAWAEKSLHAAVADASTDELSSRFAHICSTEDYFMEKVGATAAGRAYKFKREAAPASEATAAARLRFAMEEGIAPLYADAPYLSLADMRYAVALADKYSYEVVVVGPDEIDKSWASADKLASQSSVYRYGKEELALMIDSFEASTVSGQKEVETIREAPVREGINLSAEAIELEEETLVAAAVVLHKFEVLLDDGEDLLRYSPPDGKGWGVNGERQGEWHAFRERADGSCTYDEGGRQWVTEDPEKGWSFLDLAMLEELRKKSEDLPEAMLPSELSHPRLFANGHKDSRTPQLHQHLRTKQEPEADKENRRAPAVEVPAMSRKERFKQRVEASVKQEDDEREVQKHKRTKTEPAEERQSGPGAPTAQEESSAAAFLASVKARLSEWGKLQQYHEFVCALSGTIDAKAAVRILRGHDDLLQIFKDKFAPSTDLRRIKAETEEEVAYGFAAPPVGLAVKQETPSGKPTPYTATKAEAAAANKPRPPAGPPPKRMKTELSAQASRSAVKAELGIVKQELTPRPPAYSPHASRTNVTIDDEPDIDDEVPSEAVINAATKKGREFVIAELAKLVFSKNTSGPADARRRLAMTRYATEVSQKPRFPRELYVLRGPPGIGKTDYAMQQLSTQLGSMAGEEDAARLTHVCAVDDFCMRSGPEGTEYKFQPEKLEVVHGMNEARVRLAMEAGVHPLFVDCPNLKLWEMRPYIKLADRLGYVVTIVEPSQVNERWKDINFILTANDTSARHEAGNILQRPLLQAMAKAFEQLPADEGDDWQQEAADAIRDSARPDAEMHLVGAPGQGGNGKQRGGVIPAWGNKRSRPWLTHVKSEIK